MRALGCSLWLALLVAGAPARAAGQDKIRFQQMVDMRQQLSTMLQDRDGFLWIGTVNNGLYRHDGVRLKQYLKGSKGLTSNSIYTIFEDRRGVIWMTTGGGGLLFLDKQKNSFRAFMHDPDSPTSISSNTSLFLGNQAIAEDRDGALWIATMGGLNRLDTSTGVFTRFRHDDGDPHSLSDDRVTAVLVDGRNRLWVGTVGGGLERYDPSTGRFHHYKRDSADRTRLSDNHISALYEYDGILWIGTKTGGLCRLVVATGALTCYRREPDNPNSLCDDVISSIVRDKSGLLWIAHGEASQGCGLVSFDDKRAVFTRYTKTDGLSSEAVLDIHQNIETGTIWLLNYTGSVDMFDRQAQKFRLYRHNPLNPNSLSSDFVGPIIETRDGMIWIGTAKTGIDKYDPVTDTWTNYRKDPRDDSSIAANWVLGMYQAPDGLLWLGYEGGAIDKFDPSTGQVITHYRPDPDDPSGAAPAKFAAVIIEDKNQPGTLWISRFNDGISKFDIATEVFTHYSIDGFAFVIDLYDDGRGSLWIPTQGGGLVTFDKRAGAVVKRYTHDPRARDDPTTISSNQVNSMTRGSAGELWIGTWDNGLSKLDVDRDTFTHYSPADGFPIAGGIFSIVEDADRDLWLSTSQGLLRFDIDTGATELYGQADGLQDDLFFQGATRSADGRIWVGGVGGVNSFNPAQISKNPHIPKVFLTSFHVDGSAFELDSWPERVSEIRLTSTENSFDFEFVALNYTFPTKNRYAYKLDGFEDDWKNMGNRPSGRYTGVPPGDYTLRLRGSNNDGVWDEDGASIRVIIVPAWWQTTWARGGLAVLVIGFFALVIGVRMRTLRERVAAAEQLGRYTLLEKIGEGGMGEVYRARHAMLRRPTAIKLLPPSKMEGEQLARFEREVQLTSELTHPNIVAIYDYGQSSEGVFYYAMEYLDGFTLSSLVRRFGPQPLGRVIRILRQICSALGEAHARGLVHRDIKPGNIFLCQQSTGEEFIKVLDFGLVKELERTVDELSRTDVILGTPAYLAPEAITAPKTVGPAADIYAVGAVGYFLITGSYVFTGATTADMLAQHVHSRPVPPSERLGEPVPQALESIILGCLTKKPSERTASAYDLERVLAKLRETETWGRAEAVAWWRAANDEDALDAGAESAVSDTALAPTIEVNWRQRAE